MRDVIRQLITERKNPDEKAVTDFVKRKRDEGWEIYKSKLSHRSQNDHLIEFEVDGADAQIIGRDDRWELFFGPTLSGKGKEFNSLEDAFEAATG